MEKIQAQQKTVIDEPTIEITEYHSCNTCGEEFYKPILAEISSGNKHEEYYACPRCLTKVKDKEAEDTEYTEETEEVEATQETDQTYQQEQAEDSEQAPEFKKTENADETSDCKYHFGYLRENPKNMPIPEDCFICRKIIDCRTR